LSDPDAASRADAIVRAKAALRAVVLARRASLPAARRADAGSRIIRRIVGDPRFEQARVVMTYASFGTELDTAPFIEEIYARGKMLVLPRIDRQRDVLALYAVRDPASELVANRWGIREPMPETCVRVDPRELEFVLAPGVAFDVGGGRLGYGKAYYDRLLHECARHGGMPFTVAGAFDAQIVERVPLEAHDVPVTAVVTESGVHCRVPIT
jgi:5-formyltetrahydrofolate cyclo-ligase